VNPDGPHQNQEGCRHVINEDAITGTGITVAQDFMSIPERTIQRGVVKLT
jgi:hypothetical protein